MKTPKVKKRGVSLHSRAARRATSPSLNTDKSLKTVDLPGDTSDYKPKILGAQNAGISKKRKGKQLTRQQRLRQQKGMEQAERNLDKLEIKKVKGALRSKRTKDRAAAWEDLNEKAVNSAKLQLAADSILENDETRIGNKLGEMTAEADAKLLPDQLAGALAAFGADSDDTTDAHTHEQREKKAKETEDVDEEL